MHELPTFLIVFTHTTICFRDLAETNVNSTVQVTYGRWSHKCQRQSKVN